MYSTDALSLIARFLDIQIDFKHNNTLLRLCLI